MQRYWAVVKFDFVTMDGDNIYGGHSPRDFQQKFEEPYKPLLDENVKFYASLGNHDDPQLEINYKPYSMGGNRYYTFQKEERAVLRARQQLHDAATAFMARRQAEELKCEMEDCVLPSPFVHMCEVPRSRHRSSQPAYAAVHEIWRQCSVERPRTRI